MLNSIGPVVKGQMTLQNGASSVEFTQSENADLLIAYLKITSPSSLSAGALLLQMYNPVDNSWVGCPQEVCVQASGGGTPAVVNANTASATAVVGGAAKNTTGVTAITNTMTVTITAPGVGTRVRLSPSATSGTATLDYVLVSVP